MKDSKKRATYVTPQMDIVEVAVESMLAASQEPSPWEDMANGRRGAWDELW